MVRLIVLLAGVVSVLLFPILFGHALSTHETGPVVTGVIALVLGIAMILVSTRIPDARGP